MDGKTPERDQDSFVEFDDARAILLVDHERTTARIRALGRDFTSIVEDSELSATDDEHDPEGTTIAFERSQTSALLGAAVRHLADVEAALRKIDEDSYGRCEYCGEPISRERLRARPAAQTCITCAEKTV
ncbi:molecular chaperone DnaK [Aeromicrobium phragmitis]|uniref:Molecular chaperone DnaK n=1 Tax=Aeromicrobium phragmitis TaxID=2478914 RepID=A0A3L8PPH8_9ACTN|nr:TraR/DksA C4-type zinc finger protein [Aeromicrobium phragmitis]RLV57296.1 molecular chaperone DnaK [Aeromicrobium phragmitis]